MTERNWAELEDLVRQREARLQRQRLDPKDCGCTDCLVGWSIPWTDATADELEGCIRYDKPVNASEMSYWGLLDRLETLDPTHWRNRDL